MTHRACKWNENMDEEKQKALLRWIEEVTFLLCYQPEIPQAHKQSLFAAMDDYRRCGKNPRPQHGPLCPKSK